MAGLVLNSFADSRPPQKTNNGLTGTGRLNGRSERLLGDFMRDSPETRPVIATKLAAYPWRLLPGQWVAAARASSKRLGLERVPVVQLHW